MPVLLRDLEHRPLVRLPEAPDHLLLGESRLLHGSLTGLRAPFSQVSAGPKNATHGTVTRKRKLIEQVFGWMKTFGGLRKLRHRGGARVDWVVTFSAAAYNLIRLRTLLTTTA